MSKEMKKRVVVTRCLLTGKLIKKCCYVYTCTQDTCSEKLLIKTFWDCELKRQIKHEKKKNPKEK